MPRHQQPTTRVRAALREVECKLREDTAENAYESIEQLDVAVDALRNHINALCSVRRRLCV